MSKLSLSTIFSCILVFCTSNVLAEGGCYETRTGFDCSETKCTQLITGETKSCSVANAGEVVMGVTTNTCPGTCEYMNCSRAAMTQHMTKYRKKQIKYFRCAQVIENGVQSFKWKQDCFTTEIKKCSCRYEDQTCKGDRCAPNGFKVKKAIEPNCTYDNTSQPRGCGGNRTASQSTTNNNPSTYAVDQDIADNSMNSIISEISSPIAPDSVKDVCVIETAPPADTTTTTTTTTTQTGY